MKRLQIMIEEEVDEALQHRALAEGVSKAALIRRFVRTALTPLPPIEADPLWGLVGAFSGDPAKVDDVVYPR